MRPVIGVCGGGGGDGGSGDHVCAGGSQRDDGDADAGVGGDESESG